MYTIYLKTCSKDNLEERKRSILELIRKQYNLSFLDLKKNPNGKPYWPPYYLSISHSLHNVGCIGIAISSENIGIDIEIKEQIRPLALKRKICFKNETINSQDELLMLWTQKEALYKYDNSFYLFNQVDTKKYDVKTKIINVQGHDYILSYTGEANIEVLS